MANGLSAANGLNGKYVHVVSIGNIFHHGAFHHNSGKVAPIRELGVSRQFPPGMIVDFICHSVPTTHVDAIGIAVAGPVNADGVVGYLPNVWGAEVRDFPLAGTISKRMAIPTIVVNNTTATALFEHQYGMARGLNNFRVITIDAGLGSKHFIDGTVIVGPDGRAGEIGHEPIEGGTIGPDILPPDEARVLCGCGGFNHLESFTSETAARRIIQRWSMTKTEFFQASKLADLVSGEADEINARHIALAAQGGDTFTLAVLRAICQPLARKIVALQTSDPADKYLITGSFAFTVGERFLLTLGQQLDDLQRASGRLLLSGTELADPSLNGAGVAVYDRLGFNAPAEVRRGV
jgi:predicted NBD/HSP70 family sugar kinase